MIDSDSPSQKIELDGTQPVKFFSAEVDIPQG